MCKGLTSTKVGGGAAHSRHQEELEDATSGIVVEVDKTPRWSQTLEPLALEWGRHTQT